MFTVEQHRIKNRNHYICDVTTKIERAVIYSCYFDGTQAQAIEYFRKHRRIKVYIKENVYAVSMRANSISFYTTGAY